MLKLSGRRMGGCLRLSIVSEFAFSLFQFLNTEFLMICGLLLEYNQGLSFGDVDGFEK
jgi:hypothetical protein